MKRRNADSSKLRRPPRRSKLTEGIYGSTFLYLKFLMVWALVLMADFILEFRFEYLWPFWLLLRSVYDSFKYQGLAFSVFFVCVAVTSDVICYLFIPIQWLFFAASTYVWVQYVWHTERGICLPTVFLWLLFVYIEASVRLREFKSIPFHLDLCRPFAAHCIGYPVVTLGFGFKSYVSYKMRMRKQKEVQKENEYYAQLLHEALPLEMQEAEKEKQKALAEALEAEEETISNGPVPNSKKSSNSEKSEKNEPDSQHSTGHSKTTNGSISTSSSNSSTHHKNDQLKKHNSSSNSSNSRATAKEATPTNHIEDYQYIEQTVASPLKQHSVNDYDAENFINDTQAKSFKSSNGVSHSSERGSGRKLNSQNNINNSKRSKTASAAAGKENLPNFTNNKDESIHRLECDIKRLKTDLQGSRNSEQEAKSQLHNLLSGDKTLKNEVYQLRQDNESLQNKLHNLVTGRQQDKTSLGNLERKLLDERKSRTTMEQQLALERKAKKAEEVTAAKAVAMANAYRTECTESCKTQRRDTENDMKQLKRELKSRDEQIRKMEQETHTLRQYKEAQSEADVLMSALAAMQERNTHLETNLSAETRVKLDLFSALGETKRQLEIQQGITSEREQQITELKSKVAEVMALMPASGYNTNTASLLAHSPEGLPHFSASFPIPQSSAQSVVAQASMIQGSPQGSMMNPQQQQQQQQQQQMQGNGGQEEVLNMSSLNPNASDYTPKITQ